MLLFVILLRMIPIAFFALVSLLASCSDTKSHVEKRRMKNNQTEEKIYRHSTEYYYKKEPFTLVKKDPYPWENESPFPKITINSLRCRGDRSHPILKHLQGEFEDCNGMYEHGLPYVDHEEFVYPVLLTLLNKVQNVFNKQVVVVSGHRCPKHHLYITLGSSKLSKYMIGARVDFTVIGMEDQGELIIEKIKEFYSEDEEKFCHFKKEVDSTGTVIWSNQEIRLFITKEGEHNVIDKKKHPVVTIDVCFDRKKNEPVYLDWNQAYSGYIRN